MNSRSLFALLLLFLPFIASAQQIKVVSAFYGRPSPERSIDVTDRIKALAEAGHATILVSPKSMGAPRMNPGRTNFLRVEYLANGRKATGTANDGEHFNLRGAGGGVVKSGSGDAPLRVVNKLDYPIRVYSVDRWGRWFWGDQLPPAGVYSTNSEIGLRWVVTTARASSIIYEFTARRGDNRISVDEGKIKRVIVR